MSESKLFRSQIGGFNRDDVNKYIKDTDTKHADEITALREEIAALTAKTEEIPALQAKITETETKLAQSDAEKAELQHKLNAADTALTKQADILAEKERELADVQKSISFYKSESEAQIKVIAAKKDEIDLLAKNQQEAAAHADAALRAEKERSAALAGEIAELQKKLASLGGEMEVLLSEKEALARNLEEIGTALAEAKKFTENADDKNSPAYKVGMYDKISAQLGDILINANRNADDLLTSAKEEAEQIRAEVDLECEQKRAECDAYVAQTKAETAEEAAYIRERLSQTASELLDTISADLHGSIEHCIREINTGFTDIQYEFKTLLSKIANRSVDMNERVTYYQTCVSESIEAKLGEMDEKYGIRKSGDGEQDHA